MPDPSADPRIIIEMLRKEIAFLKSDLAGAQNQLTIALQRLVKARGLLKLWVTSTENSSGKIREMDLGTREFLATRHFTEEQ